MYLIEVNISKPVKGTQIREYAACFLNFEFLLAIYISDQSPKNAHVIIPSYFLTILYIE